MGAAKAKLPIVAIAVGQRRRDPDPRSRGRVVEVLEIGSSYSPVRRATVVSGGRRTKIAVDTLERWDLVESAQTVRSR